MEKRMTNEWTNWMIQMNWIKRKKNKVIQEQHDVVHRRWNKIMEKRK